MPGFWDLLTARAEDIAPGSAVVPQPGDPAPEFELPASDGRVYRLSRLLEEGRFVVLAWFPMAFTPVCTLECRSLGKAAGVIGGFDVALFAASLDGVERNRRFAQLLGLDFPVLCDPGRKVAKAYGVAGDRGMCKRWTFFIGPEGTVRHIDKQVSLLGHGQSVADTLARLGAPRRSGLGNLNTTEGSNHSDV